MDEPTMAYPLVVVHHPPWNKNRVIGQRAPFKLKDVCSVRAWLDLEHNVRDSKMRGGDVIRLRVDDVCHGEHVASRASVRQSKTQRPVTFEITPTTRKSLATWIKQAGQKPGSYLFPSRVNKEGHLGTRQCSRIVKDWARIIGEDPSRYGMHSLRRTKVTILYRQTHNLRAAQILLGHTKIENTVRYLGVELDEALSLYEEVEV